MLEGKDNNCSQSPLKDYLIRMQILRHNVDPFPHILLFRYILFISIFKNRPRFIITKIDSDPNNQGPQGLITCKSQPFVVQHLMTKKNASLCPQHMKHYPQST